MTLMAALLAKAISSSRYPMGAVPQARFILLAALEGRENKGDLFNILWVLVFGFATLNILGLVARRFDSGPNRYSFGEILALLVVGASVALLGWEMLTLFKIFPIKLHSQ
jgi:CHASE2 domain-containing sensor protein